MRWVVVVFVAVMGCGPGIRSKNRIPGASTEDLLDAIRRRDVADIAELLDHEVVYAGLYFPDVECTMKFPTARRLGTDKRQDFAKCLATLEVRESKRKDAVFGVAVLEYAPGIEIEVVFRFRNQRPWVSWIGYSGRRGLLDGLPTVTPELLMASLVEGDRLAAPSAEDAVALDAESKAIGVSSAYAWMKVCVNAEGAITGVHAREVTSPRAEAAFRASIGRWKFRPVLLSSRPTPACALLRFAHPGSAAASDDEVLPIAFPEVAGAVRVPQRQVKRIAGEKHVAPDDDDKIRMQRANASYIVGSFRSCFDATGTVVDAVVIEPTGLPAYDRKIIEHIRRWKFRPYVLDGKAVLACTAVVFIYTQR